MSNAQVAAWRQWLSRFVSAGALSVVVIAGCAPAVTPVTVTIKPEALSLLGPDTTVDGARRYARRVLSANSMKNLQIAKAYAEERAHG